MNHIVKFFELQLQLHMSFLTKNKYVLKHLTIVGTRLRKVVNEEKNIFKN